MQKGQCADNIYDNCSLDFSANSQTMLSLFDFVAKLKWLTSSTLLKDYSSHLLYIIA